MIAWATVGPTLRAWIVAMTGLDLVVLRDDQRPFVSRRWCHLHYSVVKGHGDDVVDEYEETDTSGPVTVTRMVGRVQGQRTFTVRVSIESFDQDDAGIADNLLERIRTLWPLDRIRAILAPANICVASMAADSATDEVIVDDRLISMWYLDVEMNAAFTYIDSGPGSEIGWFDHADVYFTIPGESEPIRLQQ